MPEAQGKFTQKPAAFPQASVSGSSASLLPHRHLALSHRRPPSVSQGALRLCGESGFSVIPRAGSIPPTAAHHRLSHPPAVQTSWVAGTQNPGNFSRYADVNVVFE